MTDLLLVRPRTPEAERSPELSYLASSVLAAVRGAFGEVKEVAWPDGRLAEGNATEGNAKEASVPLLIIAQENIHLGQISLERMRDALADAALGAAGVVPARLAGMPLKEPIHTLRGFERLENDLPDPRRLQGAVNAPIVLAAPGRLRGSAGELVERVLGGPLGLAPLFEVGLYHDYVDYYGEIRDDILPFIPEDATEVLEVGCGRGVTGALMEERLGCRVTGVELNPEVARDAETRLSRVIVGDVETLEIEERFDAVVATELFEHLNYPERFLAKMHGLLRPGGRIVLSVPNVGHYSVVEDLLAGRWDYLPIGLLCYTHFRFFTRATLASWIERTGLFSGYEIVGQMTELPERFTTLRQTLPASFAVDEESLKTKGFYVVVYR